MRRHTPVGGTHRPKVPDCACVIDRIVKFCASRTAHDELSPSKAEFTLVIDSRQKGLLNSLDRITFGWNEQPITDLLFVHFDVKLVGWLVG